jgi:hypothetical protein
MANKTVICTYRVRADAEKEFTGLLTRHWPTLHDLGFVTDDEPLLLRREDDAAGPVYVEIFTWAEDGFEHAHEHPDVLAIWEPMDPLLESRDGQPKSEFPHYDKLVVR